MYKPITDLPKPPQLVQTTVEDPWGGPSYSYRGARIECAPGGHVCGLFMPEHPLRGRNFGVVGTVTTLVDPWADTRYRPTAEIHAAGETRHGMSEDEARRPLTQVDRMPFDRLIRIADRPGQVQAGSPAADQAIYETLNRSGPVLAYTTVEDAAQSLLPAGFELLPATYAAGEVYVACRRSGTDGELPHPHHGQWGTTLPLATCGACLRAHAALDQDGQRGRPKPRLPRTA